MIPFPATRRIAFVTRQAAVMASYGAAGAEKHLAQQIKKQRDAMLRKGIDAEVADKETRALELAIRARLWSLVLTPGGAA